MQFSTVAAVAIGGACGALCRYAANTLVVKLCSNDYLPIATFAVNMIGCFVLGLVTGIGTQVLSEPLRVGLATGFLGALTTFSTYAVEIVTRSQNKYWGTALLIVGGNLAVGLLLAFVGLALGANWKGS